MKAAPVIDALRRRGTDVFLVHTGQHYDAEMSDVFLGELGLPAPDVFLAAVKLRIPVAHLEAGLRSFDPDMPEEHNRRLTDHVSSLLLTHSPGALENLEREGIDPGTVHFVGNTMIDSLFAHLEAARAAAPWSARGFVEGEYGLVTLHRPALVDDPALLRETMVELGALAQAAPILFPAHPRTIERLKTLDLDPRLTVTGPLGYLEFLGLESAARFVLTDSGGVQEETSALGVRCFTLRSTTERPITIDLGTNTLLGLEPERIADIPALLETTREAGPIPLWDGRAGERAADAIAQFLARAPVGVAI
jgi:UDP-N-acetylglucosamine 2-epimerase (non-hydrolysing)